MSFVVTESQGGGGDAPREMWRKVNGQIQLTSIVLDAGRLPLVLDKGDYYLMLTGISPEWEEMVSFNNEAPRLTKKVILEYEVMYVSQYAGQRFQQYFSIPKSWTDPRGKLPEVARALLKRDLSVAENINFLEMIWNDLIFIGSCEPTLSRSNKWYTKMTSARADMQPVRDGGPQPQQQFQQLQPQVQQVPMQGVPQQAQVQPMQQQAPAAYPQQFQQPRYQAPPQQYPQPAQIPQQQPAQVQSQQVPGGVVTTVQAVPPPQPVYVPPAAPPQVQQQPGYQAPLAQYAQPAPAPQQQPQYQQPPQQYQQPQPQPQPVLTPQPAVDQAVQQFAQDQGLHPQSMAATLDRLGGNSADMQPQHPINAEYRDPSVPPTMPVADISDIPF